MRRPISSRHPLLYRLRVIQRQALRALRWHVGPERFAVTRDDVALPYKIYRHQSKLRRLHGDDAEEALWQENKVHNHALALPHLHNILIRPGETLSLWRLIGRPSAARGYRTGMELHMGRARGGVGGGLCQIANLVHWLALHTPMTITQRASHSFDPFPDQGRVIPYGTGAALFYNYIDLWVFNPTPGTFQLRIWLTDTLINGEIRSDTSLPHRYRIVARAEAFTRHGDSWMRHNEIWRETISKGQDPTVLHSEKLYVNHVRVMYEPAVVGTAAS